MKPAVVIFFHEECLLTAVFSEDNTIGPCPYCRCEISSIKILEKLISSKFDFSKVTLCDEDIEALEDIVIYGLEHQDIPLILVVEKMIDLGWDIDETDYWLSDELRPEAHSLFYASYISGQIDITHKLIELGCKLVRINNERR